MTFSPVVAKNNEGRCLFVNAKNQLAQVRREVFKVAMTLRKRRYNLLRVLHGVQVPVLGNVRLQHAGLQGWQQHPV